MIFKIRKKISVILLFLATLIGVNQISPSISLGSKDEEIVNLYEIIPTSKDHIGNFNQEGDEYYENHINKIKNQIEEVFNNQNLAIPDYINTFLNKDLNQTKKDIIEEISKQNAKESVLASDLEEHYNELYSIQYDLYNNIRKAYNQYLVDENFDENIASELLNYVSDSFDIFIGNVYYYKLGDFQIVGFSEDNSSLSNAYDRVYEKLSEDIEDESRIEEKTYKTIKNSVFDWVKETGMDYIKGYIGQVNQYYQILKEWGYVYDIENDNVVNKYRDKLPTKHRELELKDLKKVGFFSLDPDFLEISIDSEKNEFLEPEDIWNSDGFQYLVDSVVTNWNDMEGMSKENTVKSSLEVIESQYYKLCIPGASSQPINMALPDVMEKFLGEFNYSIEYKYELPEITSWQTEDGKLPYDIYRKENFLKVPYVKFEKENSNSGGTGGGSTTNYYEVTYDANAKDTTGKVPSDTKEYVKDDKVTVLDSGDLSKEGYIFKGWNTKADGTGESYSAKDTFNITEDTTLYAQWKKEDILDKQNHNAYIIGYPDGTVQPDGNITRAEASAIYFRLLTDEAREELWRTKNNYTDVTKEAWYNNEVSTLSNAGVIKGYPEGDFKPDGAITRAEFASMTSRFLSDSVKATNGKLNDIADHWAEKDINKLVAAGIIEGYEDGSFKPDKSITRAEAAKIVNGILERTPHKDGLLKDMKVWKDNNEKAWYYIDIQEATNTHEYERKTNKDPEKWTKILEGRDWNKYEKELEEKLGDK